MRSLTRWLAAAPMALVVFVVAGCAGPAASSGTSTAVTPLMEAPSDEALPESTVAALDGLLEQWVADGNGTGATAAVVSPAGSWSGAAGADAAGATLVPESAMSIASITKTFTAAEVLSLADEGVVDLEAPISDYVTLPFDTQGATVRQVLSMRAGFPDVPDVLAVDADLGRSWTTEDVLALIEPDSGRLGQVGGSMTYNNLNYLVLGALIEEVTGEPLDAVLRRDLIEPAGLARAWVQDAETPQPPLTVGEASRLDPVVDPAGPYLPSRAIASTSGAAGGIAADAPSIARWGYLLYGGYVIHPDLVEQMTTGQDGYGLGTFLWEVDGAQIVGHGGDMASYHGILAVWPDGQTSVVVLVPNVRGTRLGTGTDETLAAQIQESVTTPVSAG